MNAALLKQQKWAESESILKRSLDPREKVQPEDWSTFDSRSLLGGCLLGQSKFAEAESLIVGGYEGMKAREAKIPMFSKHRVGEAAERVIRLYETWGKLEMAAEWIKKIAHGSPTQSTLPDDVFAAPAHLP